MFPHLISESGRKPVGITQLKGQMPMNNGPHYNPVANLIHGLAELAALTLFIGTITVLAALAMGA